MRAVARERCQETTLSPEAFAVFWLLQREEVGDAENVARAAGQAFAAYPHWQTSTHQEQEVRKAFYKALITAGAEGVVDLAQKILRMLRRAKS